MNLKIPQFVAELLKDGERYVLPVRIGLDLKGQFDLLGPHPLSMVRRESNPQDDSRNSELAKRLWNMLQDVGMDG